MNAIDIHSESAEEGIGTAILDMLAECSTFSGVFFVSVEDDESFIVQMLDLSTPDFDSLGVEELKE